MNSHLPFAESSRQVLRLVLEAMPSGVVVFDSAGIVVMVNRRLQSLVGYDRDELVGGPIESLVPERLRGEHIAHRQAFLVNASTRPMGSSRDFLGLRKDGVEFPVEIGLNTITIPDGVFVLGVMVDISERKRSEDALKRTQQRVRSIFDSSLDAIVAIDEKGIVTDWNAQAGLIFGWDKEEAVGRSMVELIVPERYRHKHNEGLRHFLATGEGPVLNKRLELSALRRSGEEFPIELTISPGRVDSHYEFSAFVRDLTERKQAELELRRVREDLELRVQARTAELQAQRRAALDLAQDAEEARKRAASSEERLNLALKASGVGTWNWDLIADSIFWDDYLHPLFGLLPGEFSGRFDDAMAMLHVDDRDRVGRAVASAIADDAVFDTEFQVVWPDGSVHALGSRGKVYRDASGHALRMSGVCWDITEQKKAEQALKRTANELARSNSELEQFAYIASHDLQEPLRKVQAFGDLLAAKAGPALGEQERDYLKRMQAAAQRMQGLINDLLAFARVTSQARPFVPVDLSCVAREVLADLESRVKLSGGHVEIGALPQLDSDPLQMRQLLQNLIGNALKFHRLNSPPTIAVEGRVLSRSPDPTGKRTEAVLQEDAQPDQICELTVRDNGIGFEEKYLDRIFLPFQRLHGRGEYEGTGMGLAICRKIVERHGGIITAQSTLGEGTTFIVHLPLRQLNGEPPHA